MEDEPAPLQGYDALFVKPLESKYKCPICKKALRNPVQTPCAHRLCENCVQPILRSDNPRCPIDDEELVLDEVFRDVCCRREVMELKVYCNNKPKGCTWVGELISFEDHLNQCEFEEVKCPNFHCGITVPRSQLQQHITQECQFSPLSCQYCAMFLDPSMIETHQDTCPEQPVPCEFGCGELEIPRSRMVVHLTHECTRVQMQCKFYKEGCLFMGLKEDIEAHEVKNVKEHLEMMREKLNELRDKENDLVVRLENISAEKKELEMSVKSLQENFTSSEQEIEVQKTKLVELENLVREQVSEISSCRCRIDSLSSPASMQAIAGVDVTVVQETQNMLQQVQRRLSSVEKSASEALQSVDDRQRDRRFLSLNAGPSMSTERRLDRNDHQLTLHDIQLAEHDLKIQMLDTTSYDGVFVWKIDDFTRRRHEALTGKTTSIYSPPFYLGRFGYKVCARVYLNGDGSGRSTHVSLFFVVMRGEYDALLVWPFQQMVTFKFLHQGGDRSLDIVDSFKPDSRSASFKRPTTNMNIASGCPEFASHDIISSGNYVMDDIIYLKIVVDMRNLESQ